MKTLIQKYKTFMVDVVLRKILIPFILTFTYFFGVGISSIVAKIFSKKIPGITGEQDQTFWVTATGNEPDIKRNMRQS